MCETYRRASSDLLQDAPHHVVVEQGRVAPTIRVLECPARDDERHGQPQERGEVRVRRFGTPAAEDLVRRHVQRSQRIPRRRHAARAAHPLSHGEANRSDLLGREEPPQLRPCRQCNRHNGYTIPRRGWPSQGPRLAIVTVSSVTMRADMSAAPTAEPQFPFHHGRVALSFVGTVGDRGSLATERVGTPHALAAWLLAAGLVAEHVAPSPAHLRRALALREAIARTVRALVTGAAPSELDVELINSVARRWGPRLFAGSPHAHRGACDSHSRRDGARAHRRRRDRAHRRSRRTLAAAGLRPRLVRRDLSDAGGSQGTPLVLDGTLRQPCEGNVLPHAPSHLISSAMG